MIIRFYHLIMIFVLLAPASFGQGAPQNIWTVNGHATSVEAIAYSHNGVFVATGSDYTESLVKLWGAANGELLDTFAGHATGVRSIDISPDDQFMGVGYIVTGYPPGGEMKLWDIKNHKVLHTFGGCYVSFSSDGVFIASGGGGVNRYLQVHRTDTGVKTAQFYNGSYITSVEYSPVANLVATGGTDNTIKIWDVKNSQLLHTLSGHIDDVQTIAFSPDGQVLASGAGGWDNPGESTIKLWRVSDGKLLQTIAGHGDWVQKVTFSPDGKLLLSCGRDGVYPNVSSKIKFWDAQDGALLVFYDEQAFDLAFSPDGRQVGYGQGGGDLSMALNPADSFETHLFYKGSAKLGSQVDLRFIGPPGASYVGLWAAIESLNPPLPTVWGNWYLKFPAFGPIVLPPIPASGSQSLAVTIPVSFDLALQALIGDELTNLCFLSIGY